MKHKSVEDLRSLVRWCASTRAGIKRDWEEKEKEIERLKLEISDGRRRYGNIGEKERWARIHLARKTTAYTDHG